MHKEVLNKNQLEILPLVKKFNREYYLVGGTAIALRIGHRQSIDFDLFKFSALNHKRNLGKIDSTKYQYKITRRVAEQMNILINDVKITFYQYPFVIKPSASFEGIKLPSLIDLAAMKAYALGRRSKWKDYVDLYFIFKSHFSVEEVLMRANELYGHLFSDKLFCAQLSYFDDVDYSEDIIFMIDNPPNNDEIKKYLIEVSTSVI